MPESNEDTPANSKRPNLGSLKMSEHTIKNIVRLPGAADSRRNIKDWKNLRKVLGTKLDLDASQTRIVDAPYFDDTASGNGSVEQCAEDTHDDEQGPQTGRGEDSSKLTTRVSRDRLAVRSSPRGSALKLNADSSDNLHKLNMKDEKHLTSKKMLFDKDAREELRVERAYKKHQRNKQLWN